MKEFELTREDKIFEAKANDYFKGLEEKLKNINLEKEIKNWLERFSEINLELWNYVHSNNLKNEWVKDNPDLCKRVVGDLKNAMDLINMCHLSSVENEGFVNVKIIEILQEISENNAFPLYAANLDEECSKQKIIAGLIKELFEGALHLNYIEEIDSLKF